MSNLRIIGLFIGLLGLLATIRVYRGPRWKRLNFILFGLFSIAIIAVSINPDIGGPHATVVPGDVLQSDYVDCVVTGEGEVAFNRLCEAVLGDSDWRQIDGIAFRDNDNVVVNPSTDYIKDMDTLPFAARHLVPMHKYSATPINYKRWPSTPVILI